MVSDKASQENTIPPHFISAEKYAEWLSDETPCFFIQVPEIIRFLTYTDPKTGKTKSLNRSSKTLYQEYIRVINASPSQECWESPETIFEETGISESTLIRCRKELRQSFHQLDGKPLINVQECQRTTFDKVMNKRKNKTLFYKITLTPIWGYNNAFMNMRILSKKTKVMNRQTVKMTPRFEADCQNDIVPPGGQTVKMTPKQETRNKTQMFNEQQTLASPVDVVFSGRNMVFPSAAHAAVFNWLLFQIPDGKPPSVDASYDIATKFDPYEIELAKDYLEKKMKSYRKKHKTEMVFENGYVAYLRATLNHKYWRK